MQRNLFIALGAKEHSVQRYIEIARPKQRQISRKTGDELVDEFFGGMGKRN